MFFLKDYTSSVVRPTNSWTFAKTSSLAYLIFSVTEGRFVHLIRYLQYEYGASSCVRPSCDILESHSSFWPVLFRVKVKVALSQRR